MKGDVRRAGVVPLPSSVYLLPASGADAATRNTPWSCSFRPYRPPTTGPPPHPRSVSSSPAMSAGSGASNVIGSPEAGWVIVSLQAWSACLGK